MNMEKRKISRKRNDWRGTRLEISRGKKIISLLVAEVRQDKVAGKT